MIATDRRDRERLRFQIARIWRRAGRAAWTDAEMDAAVSHAAARPAAQPEAPQNAGRPIDTRRVAMRQAASSTGTRSARVLQFVARCGQRGATRDEIAESLDLPIQSVCPVVHGLLASGQLVGTDRRRPSRTGTPAEVIATPPDHATGGDA